MNRYIKDLFGDLDAWGKLFLWVGFLGLVFAICMVVDYGLSVGIFHAGYLATICILTAFGPHAVLHVWEKGKKIAAIVVALVLPLMFQQEFQSHAIYTAGLRGTNVAESMVQNTKYDGAQEATKEDKSNLEMWKTQLNTLLTENAWAASVKAEALRDQVQVAQKEIDLETARGGCKTKCAQRMKDKADLSERIGKIEQATDLNKRIEATQRILDSKRDAAAKVDYKPSTVEMGGKFLAKLVAMRSGSLKANEMQSESTDQYVNLSMALTATAAPALGFFLAGLFRLPSSRHRPSVRVQTASYSEASQAPAPTYLHTHTEVKEDGLRDVIRRAMEGSRLAQRAQLTVAE